MLAFSNRFLTKPGGMGGSRFDCVGEKLRISRLVRGGTDEGSEGGIEVGTWKSSEPRDDA